MDSYRLDGHKLYWHLDRVLAWQRGEAVPPIYVEVSPVSFCNHRCIFCGTDFAMGKKSQLDAHTLSARLKEMGALGVRSIMFAGEGEPLLHKEFPILARGAREAGLDVALTTNGSVGDRSLWEQLLPHFSWVKFSLDAGTPRIYSRVHGVPEGTFDRTLGSIEAAIAVKKDRNLDVTLGIQFLVLEENREDIRKAMQLFRSWTIDYLVLKPYSLHPRMIKDKEVQYPPEIIDEIQRIVEMNRGSSGPEIIFRRQAMETYATKKRGYDHCLALPFWGYLSAGGDFYTCSVFLGDPRFKGGNIHKENMKDIFFGEGRKNAIALGEQALSTSEECRVNCRMARINEFLQTLKHPPQHVNFI